MKSWRPLRQQSPPTSFPSPARVRDTRCARLDNGFVRIGPRQESCRRKGGHGTIAITKAEFEEIREAKHRLMFALAVEQTCDHLLDNYSEPENASLRLFLELRCFAAVSTIC